MTKKQSCADIQSLLLRTANEKSGDTFAFDMAFSMLALLEPGQLTEELDVALAHIEGCDQCTAWHKTLFPSLYERQARMAKYCCASMYCAVHEPSTIMFSFRFFRDEPCWCINDDWTYAKFCPWCGGALPPRDFE